eukprot:441185-Pleurochrysis_carterae.AAC.1
MNNERSEDIWIRHRIHLLQAHRRTRELYSEGVRARARAHACAWVPGWQREGALRDVREGALRDVRDCVRAPVSECVLLACKHSCARALVRIELSLSSRHLAFSSSLRSLPLVPSPL